MPFLALLSDAELLARIPSVVQAERIASANVVEHLMEVERRHLYLEQACSSLYTYARERLRYSEDAALKRARVARLAVRLPRVLDELRSGAIHLTGLFLLERYLSDENAEELLALARGTSRRELEKVLAARFPRPDVPSTIEALDGAASGTNILSRSVARRRSRISVYFAEPITPTPRGTSSVTNSSQAESTRAKLAPRASTMSRAVRLQKQLENRRPTLTLSQR
jgi:hypothetical protein